MKLCSFLIDYKKDNYKINLIFLWLQDPILPWQELKIALPAGDMISLLILFLGVISAALIILDMLAAKKCLAT